MVERLSPLREARLSYYILDSHSPHYFLFGLPFFSSVLLPFMGVELMDEVGLFEDLEVHLVVPLGALLALLWG